MFPVVGYLFVLTGISHGYPVQFGARYELLSTLHDAIPDKSKILLNQHIDHIKHLSDRVTVTTSDGINYDGDIIVGADSVHSVVREHMWRYDGLDVTREQNSKLKTFHHLDALTIYSHQVRILLSLCRVETGQGTYSGFPSSLS